MKSKNSQNNNDLDSSIHSINTTENIENDYFQHLKDLAIKETYDYFKDKHKFDVDTSILNSRLDLHKELVILQLKKTKVYLDIKEYDIPKNILLEYLNDAIEELSDYEQDKLGITTNSLNYAKEKLIKNYCLFSFEKLFHSSEIKKINNLQLIKNKNTQLSNDDKSDGVTKEFHLNIFKDNAFEIWQNMFEKFKINKSKRTDIDFMFNVMKYNGLIHSNIGNSNIQEWINDVYQIAFEKIKYTNPNSRANEKRLIIYNEITCK